MNTRYTSAAMERKAGLGQDNNAPEQARLQGNSHMAFLLANTSLSDQSGITKSVTAKRHQQCNLTSISRSDSGDGMQSFAPISKYHKKA